MNKIGEKLKRGSFKTIEYENESNISTNLLNHYENVPIEYLNFLKYFKHIKNETDTTWFNLNSEFNENTINEFKWNQFESMSLEWSKDDKEEIDIISNFWKRHIPIILSVKNEYQYLAICLEKEKYGEIVHGTEPEFEDVTKVCNNFNELIDLLERKEIKSIV